MMEELRPFFPVSPSGPSLSANHCELARPPRNAPLACFATLNLPERSPFMKISSRFLAVLALLLAGIGTAAPPVVSNVRASQQSGTKLVDICYDVTADTSTLAVSVQVSADGGST